MALPPFTFDHEVSAATARQDKVEIEIGCRFNGDAEDLTAFVDHLGCAPVDQRDDPYSEAFGLYFQRPESVQHPHSRRQKIRNFKLVLDGQEYPAPLIGGHLYIKPVSPQQWHLSILCSLNVSRFVHHQTLPGRQDLRAHLLPTPPDLFREEIPFSYEGEFSYCGGDNWIPNTPSRQYFASPVYWPRHLRRCIQSIQDVIHDLERAADMAHGSFGPGWIFNVRHVETYWEFLTNDPLGVVYELHEALKLYSRRRVRVKDYDVPPDLDGQENSMVLMLESRVGEYVKVYAKTNRRIRIEVTHKLSGEDGFNLPNGPHTFASLQETEPLILSLSGIAAARINALFQHFQHRSEVPEGQATVLMFIMQFQAACKNVETAHEILQILAHNGSLVVGGDSPIGSLFRESLRRLVRRGILETNNGRYTAAPFFNRALTILRQRGIGFILDSPAN